MRKIHSIKNSTFLFFLLLSAAMVSVPLDGLEATTTTRIHLDSLPKPSKYQGYRLYVTQINIEKQTDDWIRMTCTIINTGEREVDFSKKGREHWVQVFFDPSLVENKMGGFKDNVRQALYDVNLKLAAGKIVTSQELKVQKIISWGKPAETPTVNATTIKVIEDTPVTEINDEALLKKMEHCPDLIFSGLKIVEQKKKYTTLEYSIKNIGKGPIPLRQKKNGQDIYIGIRVFLSGAAQVTRASKEIESVALEAPYYKKDLYPHESLTLTVKVNTKDKTDFLKIPVKPSLKMANSK